MQEEALLSLCASLTDQANLVSTNLAQQLRPDNKKISHSRGLHELAVTFLELCRILWPTETMIIHTCKRHRQLPDDMVRQLTSIFQAISTDFKGLEKVVVKFAELERKRGFRKLQKFFLFDSGLEKLTFALSRDYDALRVGLLALTRVSGQDMAPTGATLSPHCQQLAKVLALDGSAQHHSPAVSPGLLTTKPLPEPPLTPPSSEDGQSDLSIFSHQDLPIPQTRTTSRTQLSILNGSSAKRLGVRSKDSSPVADQKTEYHDSISYNSAKSTETWTSWLSALQSSSSSDIPHNQDDSSEIEVDFATQLNDRVEPMGWRKDHNHIMKSKTNQSMASDWCSERSIATNSVETRLTLPHAVERRGYNDREQMLNHGVSPDCHDSSNLLHDAVLNRDVGTMEMLLLFGANPDAFDRDEITPLLLATEIGFVEGVQLLITYGANPNLCVGSTAESPLTLSLVSDRYELLQLYLNHGGDVNMIMPSGNTVLVKAITRTVHIRLIELILRYGGDMNAKNCEGKTPLVEAINMKRVDLIALLLEKGANANLPGPQHPLWPATYEPMALKLLLTHGAKLTMCPGIMEHAASINSSDSIRILLKAGVSPDARRDGIYTPLCSAIRDDRADIVSLLLTNRANPNLPASEYPTFKCISHNRVHLLPPLVAAGADLHNPPGIVQAAVASGNIEVVEYLLLQRISPNAKSKEGDTALTTAIHQGRVDMVALLLDHGANPLIKGQDWPIVMAVRKPAILKKLLNTLEANQINSKGLIELAVEANQLDSIKILLAAGVSVEDKSGGVFSPLTTAIRADRRDIVRFLLDEAHADVNSPGEHLPLVSAIRRSQGSHDTEVIEWLLDKGADVNQPHRGWNAIMQGLESGNLGLLQLLLSRGAKVNLETVDEDGTSVKHIVDQRGWEEARLLLVEGAA